MSKTTTKAEHTSFIVLFFLSSASLFIWTVYVFGNPIFFSQVWLETSKEASIVKCTAQINKKYGMQTGLKLLLNCLNKVNYAVKL